MKYKAICFDIDGTLYSKETLHRIMAPFVFTHPNLNRKYSKMRKVFRKNQDNFGNLGLANASMREREIAMMKKAWDIPENRAEQLVYRYYRILEKTYRKLINQPDSVNTLKALKEKGYKIGVFSDWPLYNKLSQIGVKKYVDFASCSDDVKLLKPNTHCFENLMYNLKVEPSEVLYVGDSYPKDVVGASSANIDTVLLKYDEDGTYEKATKVFENWKEFSSWILSAEEK